MRTRAFRELALANARELTRDRKTLFITALFPYFFLALFLGIAKLTPTKAGEPDVAQLFLPLVLFIALASVALFGTALPLVTLREKGTLRLLGTTPVSRRTLLLAQTPARLALAAVNVVVILAATAAAGYLDPGGIPLLLATCVLGLAMMGALGYLVGGLLPSYEAAGNILGVFLAVLMLTSGFIVPLKAMPDGFRTAVEVLPTTYLGDAMRHQLAGLPALYPLWRGYGIIAASTVALAVLAVRTFRWDQGPARP